MSTQILRLQSSPHSDLDEDVILKLSTALKRADGNFLAAHELLLTDEMEAAKKSMITDLEEHDDSVESLTKQLKHLSHLHEASELVVAMEEALLIMEQSVDRPFYAARTAELERTAKAVDDFREARQKQGARNNADLIQIRNDSVARLRSLQQAHHDSIPIPPTPLPSVPTTPPPSTSGIKPP